MKYKDMNREQQEAFRGLFLNIINIKSQEENQYTQQAYRLLILGNGAGIVLLATFMGAVADKEIQVSVFILPLIMFFIGVILAALVLLPLMSVANNATIHIGNQIQMFFLDKLDLEQIQGYGFNKWGKFFVYLLLIGSFVLFVIGVYQCIDILRSIK